VKRKLILVTSLFAALSGTVFGALAAAQFGAPESHQSQAERDMLNRQVKEANKKRQQDIRDDTQKLFQLSSELKEAVDKSNEHLLSLDVVRKAEEVEKLAKKVKDKMKEAIGPPPRTDQPTPSLPGRPQ
jgi:TolA-binding protein